MRPSGRVSGGAVGGLLGADPGAVPPPPRVRAAVPCGMPCRAALGRGSAAPSRVRPRPLSGPGVVPPRCGGAAACRSRAPCAPAPPCPGCCLPRRSGCGRRVARLPYRPSGGAVAPSPEAACRALPCRLPSAAACRTGSAEAGRRARPALPATQAVQSAASSCALPGAVFGPFRPRRPARKRSAVLSCSPPGSLPRLPTAAPGQGRRRCSLATETAPARVSTPSLS